MSGTKPCLNPACPKLATRRQGEKPGKWAARRYCSSGCGAAHAGVLRAERNDERRSKHARICAGCGESYVQRPRESARQYAERVHCTDLCRAANPVTPVSRHPPRRCARPGCLADFVPPAAAPHRIYCCVDCGQVARDDKKRERRRAIRRAAPPRTPTPPPPRKPAPPPPPRHGSVFREARSVVGTTRLDRAVRVLRRQAPVYPESVVHYGSDLWMFGHLRLTEDELIARAERDAARQAERAAA